MANWYVSRERVKAAAGIKGQDSDRKVDDIIEAASRDIDRATRRFFIPKTETRLYRWPPYQIGRRTVLWVDQDLLAVTTLKSEAQNASPTTIASTDYFTEPNNVDPKDRIEIDISSSAAFQSGDTPQRSISVLGSWGYSNDTKSTGTVSSGLSSDATATEGVCSDASLIDVGDTLLIESEQIFVSERDFAALGSVVVNDATIVATLDDDTITLDASHGVLRGEVIRLDSEQMYVKAVRTNDVDVIRAYNGTKVATHADDTAVNINRTLTIERGVNGTTAATHADATAISKYEPAFNIREWCLALALSKIVQENANFARTVGVGDSAQELRGNELTDLIKTWMALYIRPRSGVI
jgi:hypothetical protein